MPKKTTPKTETEAATELETFIEELSPEAVDALETVAASEDPRAAIAALIMSHTDGTPRTAMESAK